MELKFGKFKGQKVEDVAKTGEGRSWLKWHSGSLDLNDPQWGAANKKKKDYIDSVLKATENNTGHGTTPAPKLIQAGGNNTAVMDKKYLVEINGNTVKLLNKVTELEKKVDGLIKMLESKDVCEEVGGEVVDPSQIAWEE